MQLRKDVLYPAIIQCYSIMQKSFLFCDLETNNVNADKLKEIVDKMKEAYPDISLMIRETKNHYKIVDIFIIGNFYVIQDNLLFPNELKKVLNEYDFTLTHFQKWVFLFILTNILIFEIYFVAQE